MYCVVVCDNIDDQKLPLTDMERIDPGLITFTSGSLCRIYKQQRMFQVKKNRAHNIFLCGRTINFSDYVRTST